MTRRFTSSTVFATALALGVALNAPLAAQKTDQSLTLHGGRVSVSGTSNIHDFTAVSTAVRISNVQLDPHAATNALDAALEPGTLTGFDFAVAASSLSSPREGLDKNMHKALRASEHPDITFRLLRLEPAATIGLFRATGMLTIAGVEREVVVPVSAERGASTITVRGDVPLLMTDYKISPPKAMLGMLRTDPKITVSFELVLTVPQA